MYMISYFWRALESLTSVSTNLYNNSFVLIATRLFSHENQMFPYPPGTSSSEEVSTMLLQPLAGFWGFLAGLERFSPKSLMKQDGKKTLRRRHLTNPASLVQFSSAEDKERSRNLDQDVVE